MFPRDQRLIQKRLFDSIFKRGTWVRGHAASLVILPSREPGKIGFIVTKKIAKSAVRRNLAKRRIRAAFLKSMRNPQFAQLLKRNNIVVVINRPTGQEAFAELQKEVDVMLSKANRPKSGPVT
jgi:ribonuclease P protein component